jgi:lysyl-tRNA synthetase class 2
MLEWYRPGFDHFMLMKEVDALLHEVLGATTDSEMITYQNAFITHLGIDPLTSTASLIHQKMLECGIDIDGMANLSRDSQLQLLFSYCIEPKIGLKAPCFVYDFPASQAALAKISPFDDRVAERFEVYFKGIELANGFNELSEPAEQRERFEQDNKKRALSGLPEKPIDEHFLQALESGLPECAGVALGIDRLLMLKTGASHIHEVINFPVSRA